MIIINMLVPNVPSNYTYHQVRCNMIGAVAPYSGQYLGFVYNNRDTILYANSSSALDQGLAQGKVCCYMNNITGVFCFGS